MYLVCDLFQIYSPDGRTIHGGRLLNGICTDLTEKTTTFVRFLL